MRSLSFCGIFRCSAEKNTASTEQFMYLGLMPSGLWEHSHLWFPKAKSHCGDFDNRLQLYCYNYYNKQQFGGMNQDDNIDLLLFILPPCCSFLFSLHFVPPRADSLNLRRCNDNLGHVQNCFLLVQLHIKIEITEWFISSKYTTICFTEIQ